MASDDSIRTKTKLFAKKALTLNDVFAQIAETATQSLSPTRTSVALTPLSAEACLRHGIDPEVLRERGFDSFWEPNLDAEVQRMRHEAYARRRHQLMRIAAEERARLAEGEASAGGMHSPKYGALTPEEILKEKERETSTLIENERRRIAKAKDRQKRELLQTLQFEQKMNEIQAAMREKAEKEAFEEEQRRKEKRKQDRRMADERRLREFKRMEQENMEREKARLLQQEQFERELKIKQERERQKIKDKRRAKVQELERARKAELHKLKTDHILTKQRQELERKNREREKKDRERQAKIEIKKAVDQQEAAARRKETEDRLNANKAGAIEHEEKRKHYLLEKKLRHERIQEEIRADQIRQNKEKCQKQKALERKRLNQLKATRDREEAMRKGLRKKFEDDEEYLTRCRENREKEFSLLKEERLIQEQLKKDNVDRIKRMHEYRQLETMRKVEEKEKRTDELLKKKEELLNQRKSEAVKAKIQKDHIMSILDDTKTGGRSMTKMLAVLESGDGGSGKRTSSGTKSSRRNRSGSSSFDQCCSDGSMVESSSPGGLCPPPDASSLLMRLKTGGVGNHEDSFLPASESTGAVSGGGFDLRVKFE